MNKIIFSLLVIGLMLMGSQGAHASEWAQDCLNQTHLIRIYQGPNYDGVHMINETTYCANGCDRNIRDCKPDPAPAVQDCASPTMIILGYIAVLIFVMGLGVFFFYPTVSMRFKMFGRSRMGYGVVYIKEKNGIRYPHVVKFEKTFTMDNRVFMPIYSNKYMFRNEYNMPSLEFNAHNVRPLEVTPEEVKIGDRDATDEEKREILKELTKTKGVINKTTETAYGKYEIPVQESNEDSLASTVTPEQLNKLTSGFYQLGLLKSNMFPQELLNMVKIMILITVITLISNIGIVLKLFGVLK